MPIIGDLTSVPETTVDLTVSRAGVEAATLTVWFELAGLDFDTFILVSLSVYSISVKLNSFK